MPGGRLDENWAGLVRVPVTEALAPISALRSPRAPSAAALACSSRAIASPRVGEAARAWLASAVKAGSLPGSRFTNDPPVASSGVNRYVSGSVGDGVAISAGGPATHAPSANEPTATRAV